MRTIAHVSDLHFGRLDGQVADGLVDDLTREPPSLLVVSGDFTQRARRWQYKQAADYLKRLPMPRLVVPGNHDVPVFFVNRIFFPLRNYSRFITDNLFPVYEDSEIFVLGVSTARAFTQKSGWFKARQLEETCRILGSAPKGLTKILVTHHPFIPSPHNLRGDIIRRAPRALDRLDACGVDLMLAGHLHHAYHDDVRSFHKTARRSALSIQAGTATSTRRRKEPNAYNWITIDRGRVTLSVRSWTGRRFEESLRREYERVDDVWRGRSENGQARGGKA